MTKSHLCTVRFSSYFLEGEKKNMNQQQNCCTKGEPLWFIILNYEIFWKRHFCLDFCLVAGCISLFCVVIGLASKIMVEDAWADGMQVFILIHFNLDYFFLPLNLGSSALSTFHFEIWMINP